MKQLRCNCGLAIFLDDVDYEILKDFSWSCLGCKGTTVARTTDMSSLSHCIVTVPSGFEVDHKDHNIHNNTRGNLRLATRSQNNANRRATRNGYKYVCWVDSKRHPWQSKVKKEGIPHYAGSFATELEAAIAGDKLAIKLFGEFAHTNFPHENYKCRGTESTTVSLKTEKEAP